MPFNIPEIEDITLTVPTPNPIQKMEFSSFDFGKSKEMPSLIDSSPVPNEAAMPHTNPKIAILSNHGPIALLLLRKTEINSTGRFSLLITHEKHKAEIV